MKTKYIIGIIGMMLLFCSCEKENEVPPYQKTLNSSYVMPKPVALTAEERAWLNDLREEYNNAIKDQ